MVGRRGRRPSGARARERVESRDRSGRHASGAAPRGPGCGACVRRCGGRPPREQTPQREHAHPSIACAPAATAWCASAATVSCSSGCTTSTPSTRTPHCEAGSTLCPEAQEQSRQILAGAAEGQFCSAIRVAGRQSPRGRVLAGCERRQPPSVDRRHCGRHRAADHRGPHQRNSARRWHRPAAAIAYASEEVDFDLTLIAPDGRSRRTMLATATQRVRSGVVAGRRSVRVCDRSVGQRRDLDAQPRRPVGAADRDRYRLRNLANRDARRRWRFLPMAGRSPINAVQKAPGTCGYRRSPAVLPCV